jgi:hypothetical protein
LVGIESLKRSWKKLEDIKSLSQNLKLKPNPSLHERKPTSPGFRVGIGGTPDGLESVMARPVSTELKFKSRASDLTTGIVNPVLPNRETPSEGMLFRLPCIYKPFPPPIEVVSPSSPAPAGVYAKTPTIIKPTTKDVLLSIAKRLFILAN